MKRILGCLLILLVGFPPPTFAEVKDAVMQQGYVGTAGPALPMDKLSLAYHPRAIYTIPADIAEKLKKERLRSEAIASFETPTLADDLSLTHYTPRAMFFVPQTWYVRPDGGTRYSVNVPTGQCNGKFDASYASTGGTGVNQNCAYRQYRYLWDDDSGLVGGGTWVIAGGDTVIVRGCTANAGEINPSNPACRVGWDSPNGGGVQNNNRWCENQGSYTCYNPPIPAGTAGAHTRILGQCVLAGNCNTGNVTNRGNLTQIFGGFSLKDTFNLSATQYVDVEGIELTSHNSACSHGGAPQYPKGCSTSAPLDDYADAGFLTDNTTANITFQDIYTDGFESDGFSGPIGGLITMTRVNASFNAHAGWDFDDGPHTPFAAGSQIIASYVTMNGNGCKQEYPLVHAFPAQACWDTNSAGFGDTWSGTDSVLDVFHCDHCTYMYNTKDASIGPHVQIADLLVTNNYWYGNMGAAIKWNNTVGATQVIKNNLIVGNCYRMAQTIPGAAQNFSLSTGLGGSYLSGFCRASGATVANPMRANSTISYIGNTFVTPAPMVFEYSCGVYQGGGSNNVIHENDCSTSTLTIKGNSFIGYTDDTPGMGGQQVGLYSFDDSFAAAALVSSWNNEFNFRNADTCGVNHITCVDPLMTSQPTQPWPGSEGALDVFNPANTGNSFIPTGSSPLIGAGTAITVLTSDFFGTSRPNPPSLGAVEASGAPAPTLVSMAITPNPGTVSSTLAMTCTATLSDGSHPACSSPVWTDTAAHSSINSSTGVVTAVSAGSDTITATIGGIQATATVNVPAVVATPTASPAAGPFTSTQSVTLSDATAGAAIYYTTDLSPPTGAGHGTLYTGSITVASNTTIKAIATLSGSTNSGILTAAYTITIPATGIQGFGTFQISGKQ